jgi:hypothetical protein
MEESRVKSYEQDIALRFPKVFDHPERKRIEQMVDQAISADNISRWLREYAAEKGMAPGGSCPYTISGPTLVAFARFRRKYFPLGCNMPTETPKADKVAEELELDAKSRRDQALAVLDKIIAKAQDQLKEGHNIPLQTALQAINLRQQLEEGRRVEIVLSVEVRTVIQEIVKVVNARVPAHLRIQIAQELERLPVLRTALAAAAPAIEEASKDPLAIATTLEGEIVREEE